MLSYLMASYSMLAQRLRKDERGVTSVEYALLVALIALGIVAAATALAAGISGGFRSIIGDL